MLFNTGETAILTVSVYNWIDTNRVFYMDSICRRKRRKRKRQTLDGDNHTKH